MKKILGLISASLLWVVAVLPANAGSFGIGVTAMIGQVETDGEETEKTVTGVTSETTSKSMLESFMGGAVYVEYRMDNRFAFGVEYVPMDVELGSARRTDVDTAADVASEADTGDRSASADVTDLYTFYLRAPLPMTESGYIKLGYHDADVTTTETLPTSSYGNASINGVEYGIGFQSAPERSRVELTYSDFDEVSITGTGSGETNQNSIKGDADAVALRISVGF